MFISLRNAELQGVITLPPPPLSTLRIPVRSRRIRITNCVTLTEPFRANITEAVSFSQAEFVNGLFWLLAYHEKIEFTQSLR